MELVTNYGETHRVISLSIYEGMPNSNSKIEAEIPAVKQKENKYFNHLPNDVNIIREAVFSVLSAEEKKKIKREDKVLLYVNVKDDEDKPYGCVYRIFNKGDDKEENYDIEIIYNTNKNGSQNNNWISVFQTTKRQKNREEKNIPNPYYGEDRECAKCDVCPEGFDLLPGTCAA